MKMPDLTSKEEVLWLYRRLMSAGDREASSKSRLTWH